MSSSSEVVEPSGSNGQVPNWKVSTQNHKYDSEYETLNTLAIKVYNFNTYLGSEVCNYCLLWAIWIPRLISATVNAIG